MLDPKKSSSKTVEKRDLQQFWRVTRCISDHWLISQTSQLSTSPPEIGANFFSINLRKRENFDGKTFDGPCLFWGHFCAATLVIRLQTSHNPVQ